VAELDRLIDEPLSRRWLELTAQRLAMTKSYFPLSQAVAEARQELAEQVRKAVYRLPLIGDPRLFADAWALLGEDLPDEDLRLATDQIIATAVQQYKILRAHTVQRHARKRLTADLDALLRNRCLRLDLVKIGREVKKINRHLPSHRQTVYGRVYHELQRCVSELERLGDGRLRQFKASSFEILGFVPQDKGFTDPCSESGKMCEDALIVENEKVVSGPELVVVENDVGEPFAVTKHEISWREFGRFCQSTGDCHPQSVNVKLPATGVKIHLISRYAEWLSESTGRFYRLPTFVEWRQIAVDPMEPQRRCPRKASAGQRSKGSLEVDNGAPNALGLVHVLGNASEIVLDASGYTEVDGEYVDSIDRCLNIWVKEFGPSPSQGAGFRLVREVS
jgi:hypothetical protein